MFVDVIVEVGCLFISSLTVHLGLVLFSYHDPPISVCLFVKKIFSVSQTSHVILHG